MIPYRSIGMFCVAVLIALSAVVTTVSAARAKGPLKLVVLGDSLSSGWLMPYGQAFPAILEASLRARGYDVTVVNAAVTNDTSWGGLARLDHDVPADTDGVILELGANDMIRMADAGLTASSLEQIVSRLHARGIPVLLAGFRMPIAWGHDAARFEAMYRSLAQRHRLHYHPDLYAGLWLNAGYRLIDGVHPSPEGVRLMVSGILPTASRFVASLRSRRGIVMAQGPDRRVLRATHPAAPVLPAADPAPAVSWPWLP